MLTDFNATLKQLLIARVPLNPDEVEISFDCPKREWSSKVLKPTVNLYLFDVREDIALRQAAWRTERGVIGAIGLKHTPVFVQLSYIITTWAREVGDEHLLLWRTMVALMRELKMGDDVLQGQMRQVGAPPRTTTGQADGVLRNPGEFWSALDNDLKPSVIYTASLPVDLDALVEAPPVFTRILQVANLRAQGDRALHTIGGSVLRKKARGHDGAQAPISEARVTFPQLGITVQTGADGRYRAGEIPEGTHRVRVTTDTNLAIEGTLVVPSPSYDLEV